MKKLILILAVIAISCKKQDNCENISGTYIAVAKVENGNYIVSTDSIMFTFNNGKLIRYSGDSVAWITDIDCKRLIVNGDEIYYTFNTGYPYFYDILKKK